MSQPVASNVVDVSVAGSVAPPPGPPPPAPPPLPPPFRTIRMRVLGPNSVWLPTLPAEKAAWAISTIKLLQPDVLCRFHDDQQLPDKVQDNGMTTVQFLQACLDGCRNAKSTTLYPRLSMEYYYPNCAPGVVGSPTIFAAKAKNLFQLGQMLNPKQTAIGLDNENCVSSFADAKAIIKICTNAGFKEVSFGARGALFQGSFTSAYAQNVGLFVMTGVNTSTWQPDTKSIKYWSSLGIQHIISQIDFPAQMKIFAAYPPDKQASIVTTLANGQVAGGYDYMFPIFQGAYNSTQVKTSSGTMFQVMEKLLAAMK